MKYWNLNTGDWFYFKGKPFIKVEEENGASYNLHLNSMNFGSIENFIKPEDEVEFCSALDYVYPTLNKSNEDCRVIQPDVSMLALPYTPLQRIPEDEIFIKYKNRFWMYVIIYGEHQGEAHILASLKAKDFYSYTEFHRTFPENT